MTTRADRLRQRKTDAAVLAHLNTVASSRKQVRKDDPRLLILAAARDKWPGIFMQS
ncbi:hypothetical protein PROFUN_01030 [Planoprotostelium fungivorum]|uniref:Uncharacterized protein n=1 Tax=Planoprotostelium fungivorum TaxID=1890364 RepID=A0A2P6N4H7_9EUKA|nr:hypothetical protein PROFUN_01030 [Planoprotostelium fungivorum]